nr:MAG TPA: Repressor protein CI [Caudoviricetes sp.]
MYAKYAKLRDKKGVTDYRVSEDTKITKSTFSDWKSGRSNPKIDKLKILADYFGVNIEYFLE